MMKRKIFWLTRDKDKGSQVLLWRKKPQLDKDGQWWGKELANCNYEFCPEDFMLITGMKIKAGEIKKCRLEVLKGR